MLKEYKTILLDEVDSVAILKLNRPEKLNAFNMQMFDDMLDAIDLVNNNDNIKSLVITGSGRAFCAGADLNRKQEESNVPRLEGSDDISLSIRHLYKPVICKIQGSVHAGALLMVTNCNL